MSASIVKFPWENLLKVNPRTGATEPSLMNAEVILSRPPEIQNMFAFDASQQDIMVLRPWPHAQSDQRSYPRYWEDEYDSGMAQKWLEHAGCSPRGPGLGVQAVFQIAQRAWTNLLQEQLSTLPAWPQDMERLRLVPQAILGVPEITAAFAGMVFEKWAIGAMARALQPGCKMDNTIVLEGAQGIGKTTFFQILAMNVRFFASIANLDKPKEVGELLRGKWIIELSELEALRRGQMEAVNASLTRTHDQYRPAYARKARDFPRSVVFGGTTNESEEYLKHNGARRFWPIRCGARINLDLLEKVTPLLWAEARYKYERGDRWHLMAGEEALAQWEQESRREHAWWERAAIEMFGSPNKGLGHTISALDALRTVKERCAQEEYVSSKRLAQILRECGWEPIRDSGKLTGTKGGRLWVRTRMVDG